ncbi:MAG: hypothetical protein Q8936_09285 [Bacillota bacterium]|nr:hypothetical protein [Bacillota bacterium]
MYSNRRRSHIHIIEQYDTENMRYTGKRIVIYIKGGKKYIYDIDNFIIHIYKNPKHKLNTKSLWKIVDSHIEGVIKKSMINYSENGRFRLIHTLYESPTIPMDEYIGEVLEKEGIMYEKTSDNMTNLTSNNYNIMPQKKHYYQLKK